MKKFIAEFKEFINRGSVVDMAIGIMIGAAFKAIVDSLVNNFLSPLIGLLVGKNFDALSFTINGTVFQYGAFIMAVINFFIVAFVLFMLIKLLNKLHSLGKRNKEEVIEEPTTKVCPFCKSEIAIDAVRCAHCTSKLDE